jgi:hypothetical protein
VEEHLINIDRLADNLVLLSAAFFEFRPEAEGAILSIGENIKREVSEAMEHLYADRFLLP